ncbi:leucine-rich repeat protein [Aeromicrobium sp. Leaf350]|uniref:leucine-rich repeat protein n=1 Tax=Aeromicrobium sp. Leaf350 TaxID=2876565 RepID=UPI001E47D5C1|nr:leucine-rich repeat protein [Aeromicrobium sp. Leaf350]
MSILRPSPRLLRAMATSALVVGLLATPAQAEEDVEPTPPAVETTDTVPTTGDDPTTGTPAETDDVTPVEDDTPADDGAPQGDDATAGPVEQDATDAPVAAALAPTATVLAITAPVPCGRGQLTTATGPGQVTYSYCPTDVAAGATAVGFSSAPPSSTLTIPDQVVIDTVAYDVVAVGEYAFASRGLTAVLIGDKVTSIGAESFRQNPTSTLTLGSSVQSIGRSAFYDNDITALTLPSSLTTIGHGAFEYNQIPSLVVPSSVTFIDDWAFHDNLIASVSLPSSLTAISYATFERNRLTTVTIPASITFIGSNAFDENPNLGRVTFLGDAPAATSAYAWNGDESFDSASPTLRICPSAASTGFPESGSWLGYPLCTRSTVTFSANGHGTAPAAQVVLDDQTVADPGALTADGFRFDGWYTAATGGSPVTFPLAVSGSTTLYARWTALHTVTFDANGHGTAPAAVVVADGATVADPGALAVEGQLFDGWYTAATGGDPVTFPLTVTGPTTLYARWTANPLTATTDRATYAPGDPIVVQGTGAPTGSSVSVEVHSTPVLLGTTTATAGGTYRFAGTLPTTLVPGRHDVVVTFAGGTQVVSAAITVAAPAVSTPPAATGPGTGTGSTVATETRPRSLPTTGAQASVPLLVGGLVLLAAGLVLLSRRQGRSSASQ